MSCLYMCVYVPVHIRAGVIYSVISRAPQDRPTPSFFFVGSGSGFLYAGTVGNIITSNCHTLYYIY